MGLDGRAGKFGALYLRLEEAGLSEEKVFIIAGLPRYTYFLRATNQPVKRYSIAPSAEGVISCYFKSPHPRQKFVAKHYMAKPPPL